MRARSPTAITWLWAAIVLAAAATAARAGYVAPSYIDGCQSADGRYIVTAENPGGKQPHGPFKWRYVWRDTKEDKSVSFDAHEV